MKTRQLTVGQMARKYHKRFSTGQFEDGSGWLHCDLWLGELAGFANDSGDWRLCVLARLLATVNLIAGKPTKLAEWLEEKLGGGVQEWWAGYVRDPSQRPSSYDAWEYVASEEEQLPGYDWRGFKLADKWWAVDQSKKWGQMCPADWDEYCARQAERDRVAETYRMTRS